MFAIFVFFIPVLDAEELTNANVNASANTSESISPEAALEIQELNSKIDQNQKKVRELDDKIKSIEKSIEQKRTEQVTLENEISVVNDQVTKAEVDIEKTELTIDDLLSDIEKLESDIQTRKEEIGSKKSDLADLLVAMYKRTRKTTLEITLTEESFGMFFMQNRQLENVRGAFHNTLDKIEVLKKSLESQKLNTITKKTEVEKKKEALEQKKSSLDDQRYAKNYLLIETKENEEEFQALVKQMKDEQQGASGDIQSLERQIREKIEQGTLKGGFEDDNSSVLAWPATSRRITAYFHDPSYPFNYIFLHPAIDIGVKGGTPIYASASGYVSVARKKDWITNENGKILYPAYNYVSIVHNDGVSTVYGHLSEISVSQDQFVTRGQQIGESGYAPGTKGVGRLYTGPHLHFEVRVNGIPVDPLGYLPN
ncbi:MAG: peptidoglycan DD-metalloendopeptidase family protein [Patescibacteria group bacterium]